MAVLIGKHTEAMTVGAFTFEMGMRKLSPKLRMVLVSSTVNTTKAAFSKSVSCTCRDIGGGGREGEDRHS